MPEREFSLDDVACCDDIFESDIAFVLLREVFCKRLEIKVVVWMRNESILKKETKSISPETIKAYHLGMPCGQSDI